MSDCAKVSYPSQAEARKALTKLVRFRGVQCQTDYMEDHAYACPHCESWHLTSRTRSGKRASR